MNINQIYKIFPKQSDCLKFIEQVRWQGSPVCPYCRSTSVTPAPKEKRYHCNACNTSFSVTVGIIFHKTKVDLQKWFLALLIILKSKNGISSRQLARDIEVNHNTGWLMSKRILNAIEEQGRLLRNIVEAVEIYADKKGKRGTKW